MTLLMQSTGGLGAHAVAHLGDRGSKLLTPPRGRGLGRSVEKLTCFIFLDPLKSPERMVRKWGFPGSHPHLLSQYGAGRVGLGNLPF